MTLDPWNVLHAVVAGAFGLGALRLIRDVRDVPSLPPLSELCIDGSRRPAVSIVVPARDEAARIGTTVERLLEQEGVDVEVIVVDDRSQDATGRIVADIAARDPRVRLLRVDLLPAGWLGKPHACQRGGEAARAEWLLFTDGDVWLSKDVLARATELGRRASADHVVVAPRCKQSTFLARVALNAFAASMAHMMALANRDSPRRQVGIGAFNLVRREAWLSIGGHAGLAYEVVDDLRLGLILRRGGFRTRACLGLRDAEAEWAGTIPLLLKALEKNAFAQMRYSVSLTLLAIVGSGVLWLGALSGPFFGTRSGWAAFAALGALAIPAVILARREREPMAPALLMPLGFGMLALVLAHSTIVTLRQGGVAWRGTLYPLDELRARRVR